MLSEDKNPLTIRNAMTFVILMGLVSLFADMTYEGARSITGPFLAMLGASGFIVGLVSGIGEWIGYSLRLVFGFASDRTGRYWTFVIAGYAINLLAVPLLAWAGSWQVAAGLIVIERLGKAIRSPSKDALLSYATQPIGRGWGFGIHEAMDQTGAVLGPLLMALVLYYKSSYQFGFGLLLIPALLALVILCWACLRFPNPSEMESTNRQVELKGLNKSYWLYVGALSLVGAGYVDFPLIAYHFQKSGVVSPVDIPLLYALAMGIAGLASLILGKIYDRYGLVVIIWTTLITALFAPLVFLGSPALLVGGMLLWGIGLGAQESIMRAVVAHLVGKAKRATAYGMLNIWFGTSWVLGSALLGYFYDVNLSYLVTFSVLAQLSAIPLFLTVRSVLSGST